MSDVQLALLILGIVVIVIMIIHNWVQIYRHKKRKEKFNNYSPSPKINEQNDPLFNSSEFPIDENIASPKRNLSGLEGSKKIIAANLPEGIFQDIEAVASITSNQVFEGKTLLDLDSLRNLRGVRLYVRKDDDIWSTDSAIDDSIRFNQILVVQLLASRKGALSDEDITNLNRYVDQLKAKLTGTLFWIANEQIKEESKKINDFRVEVDRALILKVLPKSDTSFHSGALIDFFNNDFFKMNKNNFHEVIYGDDLTTACQVLNLSGNALEIKHEAFIQGIVFRMDIPNTKNITQSYNQMMSIIQQCCNKLNGILVDASSKPMNEDYVSRVYTALKGIEQKMIDKKVVPGSDLANKIFS
jgi:FtsZ-interacting cell division protein ZipA